METRKRRIPAAPVAAYREWSTRHMETAILNRLTVLAAARGEYLWQTVNAALRRGTEALEHEA